MPRLPRSEPEIAALAHVVTQRLRCTTRAQNQSGGEERHSTNHSQYLSPLSKMIRHTPGSSCRQIDVYVDVRFPSAFQTGPVLIARFPDSSTETVSGAHEKGGSASSKKASH